MAYYSLTSLYDSVSSILSPNHLLTIDIKDWETDSCIMYVDITLTGIYTSFELKSFRSPFRLWSNLSFLLDTVARVESIQCYHGGQNIPVWDVVRKVSPMWSVYQAAFYAPNSSLQACYVANLACMGMLYFLEMACTAGSAAHLRINSMLK